MFDYPYLVELLSPRASDRNEREKNLDRFSRRYHRIMEAGCGVSIPDNPMGQPRMPALECIESRQLPIDSKKVMMNLNTFHTKTELDGLLEKAAIQKIEHILVIRGDGGPLLPKLNPESINGKYNVATSIDLIRYINTEYPGQFITGAAFNPYKSMPLEYNRMKQKIEAGAKYVVTQPIFGKDERVSLLENLHIPIVVEAWMSINVDLLYKSVGKEKDERAEDFDPVANLRTLHEWYPESCVYLSMLGFRQDWKDILPRLTK
jgi:methylenetetrahydrofolate reductase (NADH)